MTLVFAKLIATRVFRDGRTMMEFNDNIRIGRRYIVDAVPEPARYFNLEHQCYWEAFMVQDAVGGYLPAELLEISEVAPSVKDLFDYQQSRLGLAN